MLLRHAVSTASSAPKANIVSTAVSKWNLNQWRFGLSLMVYGPRGGGEGIRIRAPHTTSIFVIGCQRSLSFGLIANKIFALFDSGPTIPISISTVPRRSDFGKVSA